MPPTAWVGQPMSSRGVATNKLSTTTVVHSLLAPFTERFNLRIRTPPRTVPNTASGIQIPPEEGKVDICDVKIPA